MNVIHTYTRQQALADGVLVDIDRLGTLRTEAGIRFPAALTSRLFEEVIKPPSGTEEDGQSLNGRLWDTLWMLGCAMRGAISHQRLPGPGPGQTVLYPCLFVMERGKRAVEKTIKAVCGPGDQGEPVLTLMLPEED